VSQSPSIEAQGIAAESGLAFQLDADGRARVAWGEPDWLGPVGLRFQTGGAALAPRATGARPFEGRDDLGAHQALALAWDETPLAVRCSVRAYRDRPLLVFRLEAAADLAGFATQIFDAPSVAWPWLRADRPAPRGRSLGGGGGGRGPRRTVCPTARACSGISTPSSRCRPSRIPGARRSCCCRSAPRS
jgi:hypothetical protein